MTSRIPALKVSSANQPSCRARRWALSFGALMLCGSMLAAMPVTPPAMAQPSVFPTGVTRYDPALAYNSYVLFGGRDGKTHLIDMNGNEVHSWNLEGFPSEMLNPGVTGGKLGHVLVQVTNTPPKGQAVFDNIFNNKEIGEMDWGGNLVWKWGAEAPGGAARQNHDWHRQANGNTLIVSTVDHQAPGFKGGIVHDPVIFEIGKDGKIVWQWRAADHLLEFGFSKAGLKLIYDNNSVGGSSGGFLTINSMKVLGPNHWYKSGDKRFNPENIMIGSREANIIAIIDKASGKIVWQTGPYYPEAAGGPSSVIFNDKVPRPLDQTSGQHDPNLIAEGLPGAGNLLVLDNEGAAGYPAAVLGMFQGSRVLEINPVTRQIVWQYNGEDSGHDVWTFGTSFIGSVRRLPNGNTLICEGMNGRLIQVTPKGKIVWEYINPHFAKASQTGRVVLTNWTYRAQPIPYNWVPSGTARSENAVVPPDNIKFRISESK